MKSITLNFFCLIFGLSVVQAQNLHTQSNAASIQNEANATTGWTGSATRTSTAVNPQSGSFAIQATSGGVNSRESRYTFTAIVGETYQISIWARLGTQNFQPAFANWTGFSGFATTAITSATWTEYTWTLTATNTAPLIRIYTSPYAGGTAGDTVLWDSVSIVRVDTQAPSAITTLAASNVTTNSLDLTWSASTDNFGVTAYDIYRGGNLIGSTAATNFAVTGLTPNTAYTFTALARDAAGNTSANSNVVNVTTDSEGDTEAPSAITDLTASNITATSADLSWTASTDNVGVDHYMIYQDGNYYGMAMNGETNFTVVGLVPSSTYVFTAIAMDAAGNPSALSNPAVVNTPADTTPPSAVTTLSFTNTTTTTTDLLWNPSTDNVGVTSYDVYQDAVLIGSTANSTYVVTGLTPDVTYQFTVVARDAAGNSSAAGNTVNVTTSSSSDTTPPSTISDLAASNITSTSVNLSWTAATDNVGVVHYMVYQNATNIGISMTTNYSVTGLTPATTYTFTVRAMDAAGNTAPDSNPVEVLTSGSGIVDYTSENSNLPSVDWQANNLFANGNLNIGTTGATGYRLSVAGRVIAEEVRVALQTNWPDYVFKKEYKLPSLQEVESHILQKGHLINIPSAAQVEKDGITLGVMNAKLLEKIEELTLYTIDQDKRIEELSNQNQQLLQRLLAIEALIKSDKKQE